jgi:hypothetical protein
MQSQFLAAPRIYVEIYPHEGGSYAIESGQILECVVPKHIRQPAGTFEITLAPGGPNGPNIGPSWLDVITPMSFVMIGMSRATYQGVVTLGVVTRVTEFWDYSQRPVTRNVKVIGQDIGYFFTHFSWYALTFLSGPAAAVGAQLGSTNAGVLATLGGNLFSGSPDQIGASWYSQVMDGKSGILSRTWFEKSQNNPVLFSDSVTVQFEKYVDNLNVLWSFSFVNAEENWYKKFNMIFPFPWYEFFIMTAPAGFYSKATTTSWNQVAGGQTFTMQKLPNSPAQIYVIARVNPLPTLKASISNGSMVLGSMDTTGWNNLTTYTEDTRLIRTDEEFCEDEVRNFYLINPIFMRTLLGQANDAVIPPILGASAAVDPASIHRYGFRPMYMETEWFSDPSGFIAQSQQMDFLAVYADLTARLASQYEPVSLMMRAIRRGTLRPDIIPGNQFTYQPLKETTGNAAGNWTFYIEGVVHRYKFGGPSMTELYLERGLPSDIYAASSGLLRDIHMGNAQRLNGVYQTGLPSGPAGAEMGLEPINLLSNNIQQILSQIAPIYSTAQNK